MSGRRRPGWGRFRRIGLILPLLPLILTLAGGSQAATARGSVALVHVVVEQLGRAPLSAAELAGVEVEFRRQTDNTLAARVKYADLVKEPAPPGQQPCTRGLDCQADVGLPSSETLVLRTITPAGVIAVGSAGGTVVTGLGTIAHIQNPIGAGAVPAAGLKLNDRGGALFTTTLNDGTTGALLVAGTR